MSIDFSKPPSQWTDEEITQFMAESERRRPAWASGEWKAFGQAQPWDRPWHRQSDVTPRPAHGDRVPSPQD